MDCVFCKIIRNEIPSEKVYEDEDFIVIKDIKPVAPLHLLVIYKKHVERLHELSEDDQRRFWKMFYIIKELSDKFGFEEYRIVQNNGKSAGQEVPHIHFHVISGRKFGGIG
ncbi:MULTISPECIES: histidine triad nucleotide-binding protein [unclassified Thermosipho (in: thermotogales)]|uniref:histidine triad nucleotide-binding protein n=1 Tax=unclassified Thermosipho (in: thermotogales) TaxID=2676525 RepID=UPI00098647EB|nr:MULTISPECIES: histidine triad nucleotide-binding protein [unclassified Thermosipho (in: thermotogales)]MBT1247229.1 histidine triad nucleotide-binding protein [Thermosipho sp. 1244]OOC47200.1 HIT-like protein [Thermosipho sp. 1223]